MAKAIFNNHGAWRIIRQKKFLSAIRRHRLNVAQMPEFIKINMADTPLYPPFTAIDLE